MSNVKIIGKIAAWQWQQILQIRQLWLMLLVLPLSLSLLVCYIYQDGYLRKMPTVVVDLDRSQTSSRVVRLLDQHRYISIKQQVYSVEEGHKLIQSRKVYALILIPPRFEADLKTGRQTTCKAYSFGANLIVSRELQKAVSEVVMTLNAKMNAVRLAALKQNMANTKLDFPPVKVVTHNLFNPYYNYQWFIPPGIIMAIWQLLVVLAAAIVFSLEMENGAWQETLKVARQKVSLIWIGKFIPILAVMTIQWLILMYLVFPLFRIPVLGTGWQGLTGWLFFLTVVYLYGSTVSIVAGDSMFAVTVCSLTLAGAFAFSGYSYPLAEMPWVPRMFAYIIPSTYYLPMFQQFYIMGSSVSNSLLYWQKFLTYSFVLLLLSLPGWYHLAWKARQG